MYQIKEKKNLLFQLMTSINLRMMKQFIGPHDPQSPLPIGAQLGTAPNDSAAHPIKKFSAEPI